MKPSKTTARILALRSENIIFFIHSRIHIYEACKIDTWRSYSPTHARVSNRKLRLFITLSWPLFS